MHHILHIYPLGSPTLGKLIIPILQRVDWGTAKDMWIGPNSFQKPGTKSVFQRYHCNTTGISLLYLWCSEWQKRQSNAPLLTKIKTNPTQYSTSNWTGTGTKKTCASFFSPLIATSLSSKSLLHTGMPVYLMQNLILAIPKQSLLPWGYNPPHWETQVCLSQGRPAEHYQWWGCSEGVKLFMFSLSSHNYFRYVNTPFSPPNKAY